MFLIKIVTGKKTKRKMVELFFFFSIVNCVLNCYHAAVATVDLLTFLLLIDFFLIGFECLTGAIE
jgi:hypothetical protein